MAIIKNLLIYIRPEKKFVGEHDVLARVQKNLISLCKSCHMKTNCNREYWINYFSKMYE